jgi:multiple sugar transport system substrate-binding protein
MKNKTIGFFLLFVLLTSSGFGCKGVDKQVQEKMKPIALNYWRVFDEMDDFTEIITGYQALHPFVTINYKKLRYEEYEDELIEAFATDRGPDIFSLHNTWMRKYQKKGLIEPMPDTITMAYPIVKGSLKKEVIPELRTTKSISLTKIKNNFVDTVYDDVVIPVQNPNTGITANRVFGLPLSLDTLAMFYNKDLFNNAGITSPPPYWNREFQQNVKKLTKQNNKGEIVQSGVALGGSDNIERATDILSVLMMQNGTEMMNDSGRVTFHLRPEKFGDRNYNPGLDALRFYSDFANPAKEVYSWNKSLDNSLDLFTQNKLAMMFGYSYMLPTIKAEAPKLNFAIAPLPQIEGNSETVGFANYWVEVVSKKILTDSKNLAQGSDYAKQKLDTAWDFLQYATAAENVPSYLDKANKPTALRSLIESQIDDTDLGIFAEQILTAESWYKGSDAIAAEQAMRDMIDDAVVGQKILSDVIQNGAQKVQQTVQNY